MHGARGGNYRTSPARIALYPGSFKPPHSSHIHAINYLLNHVGVDRVVVIISNRCRQIPGTNLVVDAATAVALFEKMLRKSALPLDRIELVVARHRAVTEATSYVERVARHTSLLFCVGEEDFLSGDNRFSAIGSVAANHNVSVHIQVLPIPPDNVHSSQLRYQLARSKAGMREYVRCLPANLSLSDKKDLWADCRRRLKPVCEAVRPKIVASLGGRHDISESRLTHNDSLTIDPVFEFRDSGDNIFVVKYAGDTTSTGSFGGRLIQKPARRISVERRATRYFSSHFSRSIFPTRVVFFDRELRVLVLGGRPAGASNIASELSQGVFCRDVASKSGALLAKIHSCPLPENGFWSDEDTDEFHWHSLVTTLASRAGRVAEKIDLDPGQLSRICAAVLTARVQVVHLSFTADRLWRNNKDITFEDLECIGNFGDPAYDVGSLVSSYLSAGIACQSLPASLAAIRDFEVAYRDSSANREHSFTRRVAIYAALQLLAVVLPECRREYIDECRSCVIDLIKLCEGDTASGNSSTVAAWLNRHSGVVARPSAQFQNDPVMQLTK